MAGSSSLNRDLVGLALVGEQFSAMRTTSSFRRGTRRFYMAETCVAAGKVLDQTGTPRLSEIQGKPDRREASRLLGKTKPFGIRSGAR